jgi:DNA-binding PadR family transcriptional regulator
MEKAGWLKSKGKTVKGKRRRYYKLTRKGAVQLTDALAALRQFLFGVDAIAPVPQLTASVDGISPSSLSGVGER